MKHAKIYPFLSNKKTDFQNHKKNVIISHKFISNSVLKLFLPIHSILDNDLTNYKSIRFLQYYNAFYTNY